MMAEAAPSDAHSTWPRLRYAVEFPHFRRANFVFTEPFRHVEIRVQSLSPFFNTLDCVEIPADVQELEYCTAIVELPDWNFDADQLVKGLIQFGCGRAPTWLDGLPTVLPSGVKLTELIEFAGLPNTGSELNSASLLLSDQASAVTKAFFEDMVSADDLDPNAAELPNKEDQPTSLLDYSYEDTFVSQEANGPFTVLDIKDEDTTWALRSRPASPIDSLSRHIGFSPLSNFASPASFMSGNSPASFMTAMSTYASPAFGAGNGISPAMRIATIREDEPLDSTMPLPLQKLQSDYYSHLRRQEIVQPFDKELNWSGKGQHVTFLPKDPIPLEVLSSLGASMTAKVDKVLCRRIALARKTMRCSRQWTIVEALQEVYHLQNLRHFHIVQLVGSYLQGRDFSVLMYPVADCHLGTFLEDTADMGMPTTRAGKGVVRERRNFLEQSLGCLTSAIAYVHEHTTKHMDIKPQNILVRCPGDSASRRVYLADFGLSRNFASQGHSQTDGPTSRTPRYCAPEVYKYQIRGRSADIFSLGCVFAEILTVTCGKHPQDFADHRVGDGHDESFHANLPRVYEWMDTISVSYPDNHTIAAMATVIKKMMAYEPNTRPTALEIQAAVGENMYIHFNDMFSPQPCCGLPPEQYVAYEEGGIGIRHRRSSDESSVDATKENEAAEQFRLFGHEEPAKADGGDIPSKFTLSDSPRSMTSSILEEFSSLGKSDLILYESGPDLDILMEEA
jgi:serine/threonine protein kinase